MCIKHYWQEMNSNNTHANSVNEVFCLDLVLPDYLKSAFKMVELSLLNIIVRVYFNRFIQVTEVCKFLRNSSSLFHLFNMVSPVAPICISWPATSTSKKTSESNFLTHKTVKLMHTDRRDTTEQRCTYFILFSTSLSQFIEVSHLQVEAFNLNSGVTQPQLSFTAAAVIIPGLKCYGKKILFLCFIWRHDHWHWYIWIVSFELWSYMTDTVSADPKKAT